MVPLIIKFWSIAAAGWVLFVGVTYLWRRASARAQEQEMLRHSTIKVLRDEIDKANNRSLEKWLAEEAPAGVEIYYVASTTPVVSEGKVDGFDFSFRARGNGWSFDVSHRDDPSFSRGSLWRVERRYGAKPFAAGYMPQVEALGFILECVSRFREDRSDFIGPVKADP